MREFLFENEEVEIIGETTNARIEVKNIATGEVKEVPCAAVMTPYDQSELNEVLYNYSIHDPDWFACDFILMKNSIREDFADILRQDGIYIKVAPKPEEGYTWLRAVSSTRLVEVERPTGLDEYSDAEIYELCGCNFEAIAEYVVDREYKNTTEYPSDWISTTDKEAERLKELMSNVCCDYHIRGDVYMRRITELGSIVTVH